MRNCIRRSSILFRTVALTLIMLQGSRQATAQQIIKKLSNRLFSTSSDTTRSGSFMLVPAAGYAQETGVEYGLASIYNFYVDRQDPTIRTSSLMLMGTYTSKKQANFKFQSDIWTAQNSCHLTTEIRYRDWPFNYYGVGMDTWKENEEQIDQKLFRIRAELEKKVAPAWYTGINIQYDYFRTDTDETDTHFRRQDFTGKEGGQYLLVGISQSYDTRNNVSYTTKGLYAKTKLAFAPKLWSKDDFHGYTFDHDVRAFAPFNAKLGIGVQGVFRSTFGGDVPFYALRDLGGDMMMRGYYLGRYKDKNYLASQAEMRYRFHPRFGVVAFSGLGSVFSAGRSSRYIPSYGGGFRYFFSLEHGSSIRFDYAIGEKRAGEKRQSGFYISLSEAF